jgi:very-short-patch-repair endonuclease
VSEGQQRSRRVSGQRGGSPLEQDLATEIAKEGLPDPDTEYRFSAARKWRFDFAWPRHRVACEVEGGLYDRSRHTTLAGYSNDCEKYNEAALRGWRVLRATAPMIKDGTILRQLRAALSSGSEFSGRE